MMQTAATLREIVALRRRTAILPNCMRPEIYASDSRISIFVTAWRRTPNIRAKHRKGRLEMILSKTVTALSIAVALGVLGVGGVAYAAGKHKPIQTSTNASSTSALDALAAQHRDQDWHHMQQSWCDVDPNCNGWNEKMKAYEGSLK
jgi:hypothetical protein